MAAENTAEADAARQLVLRHLQQHFSLNPEQVDVLETPLPGLDPNGAYSFVAHKRNIEGSENYIYYIGMDHRLYCNHIREFARLLREYRYLQKQDWTAAQLLEIYQYFSTVLAGGFPITEEELANNASLYAAYPQVRPPKLVQSRRGLTISFFVSTIGREAPMKWTVTVSSDYQVEARQDEPLKPLR